MYQDTDNVTALEADMATDTSTIRAGAETFTLINVFSVSPDHQQELANVLIEATEHTMRHLPGFISANIHTSFTGDTSSTTRSGTVATPSKRCYAIRTPART
jgi:hypothetical protein